MRPNTFRGLLKSGKPTLCTRLYTISPSMVEAAGHTGMFDYIEFAAEYVPWDLEGLDNFCRALELHNMGGMIKVDNEFEKMLPQRAFGSGFQSILFANVGTPEDAKECIAAIRPTTPQFRGKYGVINRRNTWMTYGTGLETVAALQDMVAAFMIEKGTAVDQLEGILEAGAELIQWGGADYSWSVGKPGEHLSPEVKAVEKRVIETCLKAGVPPRAEIRSVDQAKFYLDMGVRHLSLGTDLVILHEFWKKGGEALRKEMGS
jgi:2-keto-3-deoxy-L-rhamnonate aldolase RhmA